MSGKEQAAVSFFKCGPKILCIRITRALVKRANSWSPLLGISIQQLGDVRESRTLCLISSPNNTQAHLGLRTSGLV